MRRYYEVVKNKIRRTTGNEDGKVGWILLWALGVPVTRAADLVRDPWLYVK